MSAERPGPVEIIRDLLGCIVDARARARVRIAPTKAPVGPLTIKLMGEFVLTLDLVIEGGEIRFDRSILSIEPELKPLPGVGIEGLGFSQEGTIQIRLRGRDPIDFHRWFRQIPRMPKNLSALSAWLFPESIGSEAKEPSAPDERRASFPIRPQFPAITLSIPSLTLRPESAIDLGRGQSIALREVSSLDVDVRESRMLSASATLRSGETCIHGRSIALDIETMTTRLVATADLEESSWQLSARDLDAEVTRLVVPKAVHFERTKVQAKAVDLEWVSGVDDSFRWSLDQPKVMAELVRPPEPSVADGD